MKSMNKMKIIKHFKTVREDFAIACTTPNLRIELSNGAGTQGDFSCEKTGDVAKPEKSHLVNMRATIFEM